MLKVTLLALLLSSLAFAASGRPLVALIFPSPSSARHLQTIASIEKAVVDGGNVVELVHLPQAGSAQGNVDGLENLYLAVNATQTSAAFILDGVVGDDIIADVLKTVRKQQLLFIKCTSQ